MQPATQDREHFLSHTEGLWESLRGRRVFLTGGTGFFGKWLLAGFLWANERYGLDAQVHVLSRDPGRFITQFPELAPEPQVLFHRGNIVDFELPPEPFDFVIHAATDVVAEPPPPALETADAIVLGTRRVLDYARACGVRRVLLTSSGAVYGSQPPEITHIPENYGGGPDPMLAGSTYGEGKRFSEHLCVLFQEAHGIEAVIARCYALVGPYLSLDYHFAMGNFLRDALNGGPIRIMGDGRVYRSYLYAADLAVWLWTLLFRGTAGAAYNVGSDQHLTVEELASKISRKFDPAPEVTIAIKPDPNRPVSRYVPNIDRARAELGLEPWVGLDEAIDRTLAFLSAG